jgi:hypothetical protein
MKIDGFKKSVMIGGVMLLLILLHVEWSYGAKGYDSSNFRFGRTVMVAPDETMKEGLVAAGADVEVFGTIEEGLKAFGANVVISGDVYGELIVFGSNVVLSGKFHKKVRGAASNLILSGTFDDTVEVVAAKISLTPTAVLKGDFFYSTPVLNQQAGSQILGKTIRKGLMTRKKEIEQWRQRGAKVAASLAFYLWVLSFPAFLIVGILLHYSFPKKTDAIVTTISETPWKSTGVGFVFLVVVPVGIVISFFTLVGIPTGIIAGLLYLIFLYVSRVYMGVWIGRKLLGLIKKSLGKAFFWPFVLGSVILTLLGLVPFVGWLFRLFFLLISLGAMWRVVWKTVLLEKQKPAADLSV